MGEKIELGNPVKDRITGFEGTATTRCEYVTGQPRVMVEALKDGKRVEEWFDEARLIDATPAPTT